MLFLTVFLANVLAFAFSLFSLAFGLILYKRHQMKGVFKRASQENPKTIRKR